MADQMENLKQEIQKEIQKELSIFKQELKQELLDFKQQIWIELKSEISNLKVQVYNNKDAIVEIKVESRNFKEDIDRLIQKMDKYIDSTMDRELSKQEKILYYLKTMVMGGVFSIIITVMIEYITNK